MNVLITQSARSEYGTTLEAVVDKTTGVVSVNRDGSLQVLCVNAAHKAWRGGGRYCASVTDALDHYRSPAMRRIIQTAVEHAASQGFHAADREKHL